MSVKQQQKTFDECHKVCDILITMSRASVLIVDDDREFAGKLASALEGLFDVDACHSEAGFHERFAIGSYDLLMMDMRLKTDREGLNLLKEALARDPLQAAIVMTAYADTHSHADAIGSGALTYLDKRAFSPALIARTVEAFIEQGVLKRRLAAAERQLAVAEHQETIGTSQAIKDVIEQVRQAAEIADAPVTLMGESGSGRELAARTLHRQSRRRVEGPFVKVTFGRCRDVEPAVALLGAVQFLARGRARESKGWIDEAKGGVLYLEGLENLDEAGSAAVEQLLETRRFKRVGGSDELTADVQILLSLDAGDAAVWNTFRAAVSAGGGIEIRIPALRERRGDIAPIAQYILEQFYRLGRTRIRSLRTSSLTALESHSWPGNVRELRSAIEYAAVRADADNAREIGPEHLPLAAVGEPALPATGPSAFDYQVYLARAELGLIEAAIERFETTKKVWLAERLGYNDRFSFARRIQKIFRLYPRLREEFTGVSALFGETGHRKGKRHE